MTDADHNAPGNIPGRRELAQKRRRDKRTRKLRFGAVAVAGALAFSCIAGAALQGDDLRAGLAGLTTPLVGPDRNDESQSAIPTDSQDAAETEQSAAGGGEAGTGEAGAAEAAEAQAAGEAQTTEDARAADAAAAAEAQAAEEQAAAEQAAQDEAAAQAAEQAAAEEAAAAEAAAQAAEEAAAPAVVDDPAGAKAYAASALAARGWAASEMTCLDTLWEKESNWMTSATNASSGAYGIVQSLPAEKMASAGGDYLTNYKTQINWGLDYIASRYGTPCGALNFHYANNWY
ncbi:hypothetical protein [Arthrobacter jiangjiafuii]|uniref:aggregation-promoting factor C-terminal-like domain-containing protein n=1 Tax=Arthrobacter jiangjiafuii TaxID=2817475 RepID=UPI001F3E3CFA|nr:hypothetical protein [Arthrobacter jiangjiafuii]